MRMKDVPVGGLACAVAAGSWLLQAGCGKPAESQPEASPPPPAIEHLTKPAAKEVSAETKKLRELEKIIGRWLRPDGGYILEIKSVNAEGRIEAAYFNPNPISVTNAVARIEGDDIKILVELSGQNYPGSRYELTFITAAGLMAGTYYQAALKQTFDVVFERAR